MLKRSPKPKPKLKPKIIPPTDVEIKPPAAKLLLSGINPGDPYNGYKVRNRNEHEAELSKARVDSYRDRQVDITKDGEKKDHPRACCTVAYDGDILNMLVAMGQILDTETDDPKEVGKAISGMLAESAQHWKAEH
jgi:hypothetical protein